MNEKLISPYYMLGTIPGLYYIRANENEKWVPIKVFMCGDEHGEENGFYFINAPDIGRQYINQYLSSQFKAADKTALKLAILEKEFQILELQKAISDLKNQLMNIS